MTDLKVVQISGVAPNGDNVEETLEQALGMVNGGGIDNCIVVMTCSNQQVVDCWANRNNPFTMVGALESIKRDFMDANIEGR